MIKQTGKVSIELTYAELLILSEAYHENFLRDEDYNDDGSAKDSDSYVSYNAISKKLTDAVESIKPKS